MGMGNCLSVRVTWVIEGMCGLIGHFQRCQEVLCAHSCSSLSAAFGIKLTTLVYFLHGACQGPEMI